MPSFPTVLRYYNATVVVVVAGAELDIGWDGKAGGDRRRGRSNAAVLVGRSSFCLFLVLLLDLFHPFGNDFFTGRPQSRAGCCDVGGQSGGGGERAHKRPHHFENGKGWWWWRSGILVVVRADSDDDHLVIPFRHPIGLQIRVVDIGRGGGDHGRKTALFRVETNHGQPRLYQARQAAPNVRVAVLFVGIGCEMTISLAKNTKSTEQENAFC
jgi:hypothetical protein